MDVFSALTISATKVKMAGTFQVARRFGTSKLLLDSLKEPLRAGVTLSSHEGSSGLWKKLFFFVCCPSILVAYLNVAMAEEHPPPEFKKYPHLRIRNKTYPWRDGVKTLFHNPHTNPLPDGYEGHH